jgi:transcriptional regulator with XRE-family HTH domain
MSNTGSSLSATDILEILRQRHELKRSRKDVAKAFGISTRTVTRITNGESWAEIVRVSEHKASPKVKRINPLPRGYDKNFNELANLKRTFGFDFYRPIHWGTYDSWDGKRQVATDGIIMWLSKHLLEKAIAISQLGDDRHPFFSGAATELDTFEISQIMDAPIGEPLTLDLDEFDGIIRYKTATGRFVFIAEKFVQIAKRVGLTFFEIENNPNYVFMVKVTPEVWDFADGTQACLAVMQEENEHDEAI